MTQAKVFMEEKVPQGKGPLLRKPERSRSQTAPLGQMPHAADTWLRLQCGARAPEDRERALGVGCPFEVFRTAGRRRGNSAVPG